MKRHLRFAIPVGIGILAAVLLAALYFAIVSLAESPEHAIDLFKEDRQLVIPILLGFGVQAALYSVLKLRLYLPEPADRLTHNAAPGASMGAGGTTSTVAMVACCAHHVTDVMPVLGLSAAATFLAEYQTTFMVVGLATNLIGIVVILAILLRARRAALAQFTVPVLLTEEA